MAQATKSTSSATDCTEYYCEKCSVKLNIPRSSLLPITLDENGQEQSFRCDSCNCIAEHCVWRTLDKCKCGKLARFSFVNTPVCDSCYVTLRGEPKGVAKIGVSDSMTTWYEANKEDLKDMWESMGDVERFEEGGDFTTFCIGQYEDSRDFSNSGL